MSHESAWNRWTAQKQSRVSRTDSAGCVRKSRTGQQCQPIPQGHRVVVGFHAASMLSARIIVSLREDILTPDRMMKGTPMATTTARFRLRRGTNNLPQAARHVHGTSLPPRIWIMLMLHQSTLARPLRFPYTRLGVDSPANGAFWNNPDLVRKRTRKFAPCRQQ